METLSRYQNFQSKAFSVKLDFLSLLIELKKNKKAFAAGAAAKGNTLLNYVGVKDDLTKVLQTNIINKVSFCRKSYTNNKDRSTIRRRTRYYYRISMEYNR